MKTCHACGTHVVDGLCTCPHCGAAGVCARGRTAAAALLGLALTGCDPLSGSPPITAQPLYGDADTASYADVDGDGWTPASGDCDDADDTVHPEAAETAGDGVDSNCDGNDDS